MFIFNEIFPILFGRETSILTVVEKVSCDMLFISPLICLPVAYLTKAAIFQYPFKEGISRYFSDLKNKGLLQRYWSVWIPVQSCTFSIVPEHLRIPFIAVVSFFWLIILSSISSDSDQTAS
mmetsp:Transcript_45863/g.55174  ORF Transcript_45863/g.55174 Transcript_45863/m.55174 type:complete len:121 (+) Transcript_45863:570-932(+)